MSGRGSGSTPVVSSALAGTATLIKGGKCSLDAYHILNTTTAECYVYLYDKLTAAEVTVGTTTAAVVLGIPAETGAGLGAGAAISLNRPAQFHNGIVAASVTTVGGTTGAIVCATFFVGD